MFLVNKMYKNRLSQLEYRNNIKQRETAKKLGISEGLYSRYKNEVQIFPIKKLVNLCNIYNISLDYIFEFTDRMNYPYIDCEINIELLSKRLKEFRNKSKLTQEKLANILSIGKGTIAEYENGKYTLSTYSLFIICSKYHISADYLLGRTDINMRMC